MDTSVYSVLTQFMFMGPAWELTALPQTPSREELLAFSNCSFAPLSRLLSRSFPPINIQIYASARALAICVRIALSAMAYYKGVIGTICSGEKKKDLWLRFTTIFGTRHT